MALPGAYHDIVNVSKSKLDLEIPYQNATTHPRSSSRRLVIKRSSLTHEDKTRGVQATNTDRICAHQTPRLMVPIVTPARKVEQVVDGDTLHYEHRSLIPTSNGHFQPSSFRSHNHYTSVPPPNLSYANRDGYMSHAQSRSSKTVEKTRSRKASNQPPISSPSVPTNILQAFTPSSPPARTRTRTEARAEASGSKNGETVAKVKKAMSTSERAVSNGGNLGGKWNHVNNCVGERLTEDWELLESSEDEWVRIPKAGDQDTDGEWESN